MPSRWKIPDEEGEERVATAGLRSGKPVCPAPVDCCAGFKYSCAGRTLSGAIAVYSGSCHCGRIAFEVEGAFSEVIECNCSHCSRKGYLLWFVPRSQLHLKSPAQSTSSYKFNKHVINHHFCPDCGCAPFGFGVDPSGMSTAAVNVRCLEGVELTMLKRIPFDGRSR